MAYFAATTRDARGGIFRRALREDTFRRPIINIGPRIVDDPQRGLLVFGNWFGEVDQYHKYSEKLVILNSLDGGATWGVEEHSVGFKQYEPAATFHEGQYRIVTRDQNEVRGHRQMSWQPGQQPSIKRTNLQDPRLVDTVDLSFNPVTKRLEIVRSERHRMELWLWSMAPADWAAGHWRRECRLFQRRGRFYSDADGFHPAGAVMDRRRGVQHIFIYTGHPNGPAGVFRLTRTLDTPKLVECMGRAKAPRQRRAGPRLRGERRAWYRWSEKSPGTAAKRVWGLVDWDASMRRMHVARQGRP